MTCPRRSYSFVCLQLIDYLSECTNRLFATLLMKIRIYGSSRKIWIYEMLGKSAHREIQRENGLKNKSFRFRVSYVFTVLRKIFKISRLIILWMPRIKLLFFYIVFFPMYQRGCIFCLSVFVFIQCFLFCFRKSWVAHFVVSTYSINISYA